MKFHNKIKGYLLSVLLFGSLLVLYLGRSQYSSIERLQPNREQYLKITNFEDAFLQKGLEAGLYKNVNIDHIKFAIIPHHLIPYYIHTDLFSRLKAQNTKHVILIGPNHKDVSNFNVVSTPKGFETAYGASRPDYELLNFLDNKYDFFGFDDKAIYNEHSITSIIPYIHYYLPNADTTVFIVDYTLSVDELLEVSRSIKEFIDDDTVVLASIDFSHYLNSYDAMRRDLETQKLIEEKSYGEIINLDEKNLDSPDSLIMWLNLIDGDFSNKCEIIDNTNSGIILGDPYKSTTSYFYILCQ